MTLTPEEIQIPTLTSAEIAEQTAMFLAKGGKVKEFDSACMDKRQLTTKELNALNYDRRLIREGGIK